MKFYIAQFFGILVVISNILSMQMKEKKKILFMFVLVNLFSAINFILLDSYSGAVVCIFAIIQTYVNKKFEKDNKKVPVWLIGVYIAISVLICILTYESYIDIFPCIGLILFTLIIIQEKEKRIRMLSFVNTLFWIVYDFWIAAFSAAISDSLSLISTIIGIYRFDYLKKKEKGKISE